MTSMQQIQLKNIHLLLSLCTIQISQIQISRPRQPYPRHWKLNQRIPLQPQTLGEQIKKAPLGIALAANGRCCKNWNLVHRGQQLGTRHHLPTARDILHSLNSVVMLVFFPSRRCIRHSARRGCIGRDEAAIAAPLLCWPLGLAIFSKPVAGCRGQKKMTAPTAVAT